MQIIQIKNNTNYINQEKKNPTVSEYNELFSTMPCILTRTNVNTQI